MYVVTKCINSTSGVQKEISFHLVEQGHISCKPVF